MDFRPRVDLLILETQLLQSDEMDVALRHRCLMILVAVVLS